MCKNDQSWKSTKLKLNIGDSVEIQVTDLKPFGLLVVIDGCVAGVIERIGMVKAGYSLAHFEVGATARAIVIGFRDWSNQVELRLPERNLEIG